MTKREQLKEIHDDLFALVGKVTDLANQAWVDDGWHSKGLFFTLWNLQMKLSAMRADLLTASDLIAAEEGTGQQEDEDGK